ncbi:RidA family protein [bacterium]|nr:RidA family protein [bacterium]
MKREIISTIKAPQAIGPYSQAVKAKGTFLFTAGQIPLDPATGEIVGKTAAEQAEQALKNLQAVLEAGESDLAHVVKVTVFLQDMNDFASVNEVYARFFPENPPARSAFQVGALPKGALIEIECIALVP